MGYALGTILWIAAVMGRHGSGFRHIRRFAPVERRGPTVARTWRRLAPVMKNPETIVETPRLRLRTWARSDVPSVLALFGNPDVLEFTGADPFRTAEEAERFIEASQRLQEQHGFCEWAVEEKSGGEFVGACGVAHFDGRPELGLGYHFLPGFWGKGYATEAASASVRHAFTSLGAGLLAAMTDPRNIGSQRVLERCGFQLVGFERADDGTDALLYIARRPASAPTASCM